jgi:hypothetical protein
LILFVESRPCPVRVYDADGNELNEVTMCNTDTGEVEQFVRKDGNLVVENGRYLRNRSFQKAPLTITKMDGELIAEDQTN